MSVRSVLRDTSFRRLWAGMAVSKLGTSVASIATPLIAVQVLDASALTVSLLTAAAWLPWLLIGLPAGAWIDRVTKRPVMLVCDLISALVIVSVPLAAWLYHLTVGHLLAVAMLVGAASVFFQVAWTAYLPAMFDKEDLVGANSVLQGSESAVQIVGPAAGGALIAAVSAVAGLLVDALTFVISAISLLLIRRPERRPTSAKIRPTTDGRPVGAQSEGGPSEVRGAEGQVGDAQSEGRGPGDVRVGDGPVGNARAGGGPAGGAQSEGGPVGHAPGGGGDGRGGLGREIAEGVRWLAREPLLRSLTINGAVANLALTGYGALMVVFLVRDLGVGTGTVGLLMATSGIGGVVAASLTSVLVRLIGAARAMVWCKVGAGVASLLIPLSGPGWGLAPFVLGYALVASGVVAGNVIANSFRQSYVPSALLARVVTGMQFVNLGSIPLGAVLGGLAATAVGTRGAIWIMTVGYALAGLILLLGPWRRHRDLPAATHSSPTVTSAAGDAAVRAS